MKQSKSKKGRETTAFHYERLSRDDITSEKQSRKKMQKVVK